MAVTKVVTKKPTNASKTTASKPSVGQSLPKSVKKLVTHRSTRPLWAKIKRTAKKKKRIARNASEEETKVCHQKDRRRKEWRKKKSVGKED